MGTKGDNGNKEKYMGTKGDIWEPREIYGT